MRKCLLLLFVLSLGLAASSGFAANIVVNPGFEDGLTSWELGTWGGTSGINSSVVNTGTYSCRFNGDGSTPDAWQGGRQLGGILSPAVDNTKFQLPSIYINVPSASPSTPLGFVFRQSGGMDMPGTYVQITAPGWTLVQGPWQKLPNGSYFGFHTYLSGGQMIFYLDDASLDQVDPVELSGKVVDNANVGIDGATVSARDGNGNTVGAGTTTAGGGLYTLSVPPGTFNVTALAESYIGNTVSGTAPGIAPDIVLQPNPAYDPDMLFNVMSSSFAGSAGDPTGNWACVNPAGASLTTYGTPTVRVLNGQKWASNKRDGDGFHFTNVPQPGTLPFNGGTIVVAARPIRSGGENAYQCLVSVLLFQFSLIVQRDSGQVIVLRGGEWFYGPALPNGQISILSLVVQPTGEFVVRANGAEIMDETSAFTFSNLTASEWYGTDVNVGKGWNGDPWSSFNGDIGDVYVWKIAIDDIRRSALENALIAKYGTAAMFNIDASAGAGGTISPVGAVPVPQNADQPFAIEPDSFFDVTSVWVDGTTEAVAGPEAQTYTFTNVLANHTIAASFTEWADTEITGTVTADPPNYPGFWNQWFYDGVYLPEGHKTVDIGFKYKRLVPAMEGSVEIWINWSTPAWSATPGSELAPPLTDFGPLGEPYVGRVKVGELPIGTDPEYTYSLIDRVLMEIPYNPQWVSIDVRGFNVQIWGGTLIHECTGDPTPDTGTYWVALAGSSTNWNVIVPASSGGDGWDGGRWINYPTVIGVPGVLITATGPRGPFTTTTSDLGTYSIRVRPGDTYTVKAFKKGYIIAPTSLSAGPGDLTGKDFVATYVGRQKLIDVKVDPAWVDLQSITSWPNTGTLGGNFVVDGKDTAAATVAADYGSLGKKAVSFLNSKLMLSSDGTTADGSLIRAPGSITGNGAWTVFAEICSTSALPYEQYYFAWTHNGDDGNCAAFGYGTSPGWGAAAHWGWTDMGWNTPEADGGPSINQWHYVAVTFDGAVEKVYLDGAAVNTENKTLDLWQNQPFALGSRMAWDDNGWGREGPLNGAMTSLEVYDDAMGAAEIATKSGLVMCKFSGKVTLEDLVTPLAGATVKATGGAFNATTTSAADGTYELTLKIGDWYVVGASKTSYVQLNPDYMDLVPMAGDTVYDFQMKMVKAVTGTVKTAGGVGIPNAVVQVGVGGPAAVTDALGKYAVLSIVPGTDVSFYADALGYGEYTETIDTSAAEFGTITKDVVLTAKAETNYSYIQNGGFETGSLAPWFLNYGSQEVGVTTAEKFSGTYAGYWKATIATYYDGYLAARVPVIPGSTYNVYYKLKTNDTGCEGQSGFDWLDAGGGSIGWWGYDGLGNNWMYTPVPGVWEQVLNYRTWDNASKMVGVRMTPAEGTAFIQIIVGLGASAIGQTLYVDDVVVDRVGPLAPPRISGQVTSSVGGTPINAVVTVSTNPDGSAPIQTLTTDALGNYLATVPAEQTYYLVARKAGYTTSAPLTVVVGAVDVPGQNFVLTPGAPAQPLVNINASTLTEGAWTTDWVNTGTLGGTFGATAGGLNPLPTVATVAGKKAVVFTAGPALMSSVATDAGMTGRSDWSTSTWVYVPTMPASANRTYFSWASRGTDFSSCELRYNNNRAFAHYGWDYGFTVVPPAGVWHNIVITYDGNLEKIYVDGVLDRTVTTGALSLKAGERMFVGRASEATGASIYPFAGSVASVRIFDQVLTNDEILTEAGIALRRLVGANNKSVLTDDKLIGPTYKVKCWGNIVSIGTGTYVISDGYTAGVTINGTPQVGKGVGDMVVVTGVVQADHSVTP